MPNYLERRNPMRLRHAALVLLAVPALALAGCGSSGDSAPSPGAGSAVLPTAETSAEPTEFDLQGNFVLDEGNPQCVGKGGYDDISAGVSVTVYDDSGKIVGVGALRTGEFTQSAAGKKVAVMMGSCSYPVLVPDVPIGPKFYQVEIGSRGKITISAEDAQAGLFAASLG